MLELLQFAANLTALVANIIILGIYLYTATQRPRIVGLWFFVAAFPIYLLISILNVVLSFGNDAFSIIPKEVFKPLYLFSLAALPLGAVFMVAGSFLIARCLLRLRHATEQGAAANP